MTDVYLLDTSVLINGWTKRYKRSVFPSVWKSIEELSARRTIISCDEVYREIERGSDDLFEWAKQRRPMFHKPDDAVISEVRRVMKRFPNFAADGGSRNSADPWVIAHAIANDAIVVTDEGKASKEKDTRPPKIPNACEAMSVRWMTPIDFLEAIGVAL